MAIIIDEVAGTISFTETTITFPYGFNRSTQVGTIIITPAGGVASFPLAVQGAGGQPPEITWLIEHIGPDDPMPTPNPKVVIHDPGGPGMPIRQTNTIYTREGKKGDAASFNFFDADDLEGNAEDGYILAKKPGEAKVVFVPLRVGAVAASAAIASTPFNAANPRLLTTITFAAKPFPRKIIPVGSLIVTGSIDTRIDLVAYLGDPLTAGVEIGRGFGTPGAAPPPVSIAWGPPNTGAGADDNYAIVPAGVPAIVHFRAEQMAASSSGWATAAAPNGARASAMAIAV